MNVVDEARTRENTSLELSPSTSSSHHEAGGFQTFDLLEDEERQPFYVGMRGVDRKYSLCKEVREKIEIDNLVKNFNPGLTNKPHIR